MARIFARALGVTEDDTYEIDAASHNSVEDIKEINEAVFTLPFRSKYKIYILDEAHMLSKSAWNAFLKTLEEPPQYVIFILATTELEKVPETILSRCQTFMFKKPSRAILQNIIEKAAKAEKVKLEDGVSELVAFFGDGAFRDAYGTLEKIMGSSKDSTITLTEAEEILGAPTESVINAYIEGITTNDVEKSLKAVRALSEKGIDIPKAFALIIERFRSLLLVKISGETTDASPALSSVNLLKLLDHYGRVRHSPFPDLLLEAAAVDLTGN
jgi:DNA polymerase-3 subunit gamma/tau